jgi:hypothetical protein
MARCIYVLFFVTLLQLPKAVIRHRFCASALLVRDGYTVFVTPEHSFYAGVLHFLKALVALFMSVVGYSVKVQVAAMPTPDGPR